MSEVLKDMVGKKIGVRYGRAGTYSGFVMGVLKAYDVSNGGIRLIGEDGKGVVLNWAYVTLIEERE